MVTLLRLRHLNASKLHLNKRSTQMLYNGYLIVQIDSLSYIAWIVITEKIVIPMTMMKVKLSLSSVQFAQVT